MTKRMISYCRVSTDDQVKGCSLDDQDEKNKAYGALNDCVIVQTFKDDFTGAKPIGQRPEGKKAWIMLRSGGADGLIVWNVSRLGRDLVDALTAVRDIIQNGYVIHVVDIGEIKSETDIKLVIDAWDAHKERLKIIERTKMGRDGKAKRRQVVGSGKPPYGYKIVHERASKDGTGKIINSYFVINKQEAAAVRLIYKWYAEDQIGAQEIAFRLTRDKVKPPYADGRNKSGEWHASAVRRILSSETYAGTLYYGKMIGFNGKHGRRGRDQQLAIPVPPIVSLATWQAAQAQRVSNINLSKRNSKRDYLLRGMVECQCGCKLTGRTNAHNASRFYLCVSKYRSIEQQCDRPWLNGPTVDAVVWDWVLGLITDPAGLENRLKQAQAAALEKLQPTRDEVDHIDAMMQAAEVELEENLGLMRRLKPDSIRYQKADRDGQEIEARYNKLAERRAELEAELSAQVISDEDIADLVQFRADAEAGLDDPTPQQKRHWLELLRVKVKMIDDYTGVVTCILPVDKGSLDFHTLKSRGINQPGIVITSPPLDFRTARQRAAVLLVTSDETAQALFSGAVKVA